MLGNASERRKQTSLQRGFAQPYPAPRMLSFDPPQIIDRFNLDQLDPTRRAQFYVALGLAVGSPRERNATAEHGGVPSPEVLEKQLRCCEGMYY
jgi:hypothetical protein